MARGRDGAEHEQATIFCKKPTMSRIEVDITTADGVADSHVFQPQGAGPWPAVLFYMDGGGLRQDLFDMAQRLADQGYYVLLPNLFYRIGRADTLDMQGAFKDPAR